jgi:protein-disulfide isomerase
MSTIVVTVALSAEMSEKDLTKYFKKYIVKNPSAKVVGVDILDIRRVKDHKEWKAYLTIMNINHQGKDVAVPQTVFVNGDLIASKLVDFKRNMDYGKEIKPKVPNSLYDNAHLLFGNRDAKHKILVFSDPQCPYCMEVVPEIIKATKEHPETFALYYYHYPLLRLHPVSGVLVRIMYIAQELGRMDVVERLYSLQINPHETNVDKIIEAVKKHTGFVVTKESLNDKKVLDAIEHDEKSANRMMVTGTPTIYMDGEWDKMRDRYKLFIK